jgi:hypothetical protein
MHDDLMANGQLPQKAATRWYPMATWVSTPTRRGDEVQIFNQFAKLELRGGFL